MKIAMGSDHAGYNLKLELKKNLIELGHEVEDCGCHSTESVDYPDFGHAVGKAVANGLCDKGIVVCGSGIGISIAANKISGVRCALVSEPLSAALSRQHNNANVVAMGARIIGVEMAKEIVNVFLNTEFLGGRHEKRVNKLEEE